ncbi:hypothetical protein [Microbulbifer epialgicus]|uniref:Uncharacterized protein n=1 Tax=Microbulbifer epialgicus TaxID=393907 RepID=A0ABV4NUF7_9GAMM
MVNYNKKIIKVLPVIISILGAQSSIGSTSIADQQKQQVETLLADMNQSAKEVADTVISDPQSAIDGGCLSDIQSIDLSVFAVDFTNTWGALYNTIKDEIINQGCTAATDWVNSQTAALDTSLQAPFGLGSISVSQGTALTDWQSALATDVEMDSTELATQVTTETLGQVPPPGIVSGAVKKASANQDTPGHNKEEWEEKLEDALDFKTLWEENN